VENDENNQLSNKHYTIELRFHVPHIHKHALLIVVGLLVLSAAWLGYNKYLSNTVELPPASSYSNIPFDIYYPSKLPSGLKIDEASIQNNQGQSFTYKIQLGDGEYILVGESKNTNQNYDKLYRQRMSDLNYLSLNTGALVVGNFVVNDNRVGSSLVTKNTWVTMFAPQGFSHQKLIDINASLKKIN
jgi:hypothetical protein